MGGVSAVRGTRSISYPGVVIETHEFEHVRCHDRSDLPSDDVICHQLAVVVGIRLTYLLQPLSISAPFDGMIEHQAAWSRSRTAPRATIACP